LPIVVAENGECSRPKQRLTIVVGNGDYSCRSGDCIRPKQRQFVTVFGDCSRRKRR